ncbi:MAG: F0F1 ATP synthase subunit gamma [Syntrophomonadaceae bacterium]|nr:F0F1 ATP synthase subunit gamma [Syntrophomonadaceae bacterium]
MAGVRDIRRRIRSVKNTQQITGAMEMVAAAKLRRAQEKAVLARPYADKIGDVVQHLIKAEGIPEHPLTLSRPVKTVCFLVMSADRGLCGAYNTNILRRAVQSTRDIPEGAEVALVTVGRKARDFFRKRGYNVLGEYINLGDNPDFVQAREIAQFVVNLFAEEAVDEVRIVYAEFVTTLQQIPRARKLLPFDVGENEKPEGEKFLLRTDYIYEPNDVDMLMDAVLPKFIEAQVYRAMLEGKASEQGARMTAMGAATENAKEMIGNLTLTMNKARQAAITKELLEIVGGAEALKR